MTRVFTADAAGLFAKFGDFSLQHGIAHHRFDIAEAIGPFAVPVTGERPPLSTRSRAKASLIASLRRAAVAAGLTGALGRRLVPHAGITTGTIRRG